MPLEDQSRFINSDTLVNSGTTGCTGTNDAVCSDCLDNNRVGATVVCWTSDDDGDFPTGIQTTIDDLCAACVSGCGPFRCDDQPSPDVLTLAQT